MRRPFELAVELAGGGQNGQFANPSAEAGLVAQVAVERACVAGKLRAVEVDAARPTQAPDRPVIRVGEANVDRHRCWVAQILTLGQRQSAAGLRIDILGIHGPSPDWRERGSIMPYTARQVRAVADRDRAEMHVLICGGGVIGASVAYFLSLRGVKATVIESTGLACAASGKSGGFLARDWCDGTPLAPLARRSFALHAELAERSAEDWGYRRLDTYGGFAGFPSRRSSYDVDWLSNDVTVSQLLGSPETTAQVHPGQFTAAMMRAAEAQGAELRPGRVTGIRQHAGRAVGVEIDGEAAEADAVGIAMGPWSILAALWLPLPAV